MEIDLIIYQKMIEMSLEKSVTFFSKLLKKENGTVEPELNKGLSVHVKKAITFSDNISTFKLPDTKELLSNSIELEINKQNRLFKINNENNFSNEEEIILFNRNIILLGDVGAGKTTTMKRLVRKNFELLFSNSNENFSYSFPIVIKLGDIKRNDSLCTHICKELGISYQTTDVFNEAGKKTGEVFKIGDYDLENAIAEYLENLTCIIFLDGLDEINYQIKNTVFKEIKNLSQVLSYSKIILSSRYVEEISSFKQFTQFEICPLDEEQKLSICSIWLEKPKDFIKVLKKLPYYDLSDRPLFLTFLILLYINNNLNLPTKAIDIYRQIVLLVIREWDLDKEVEINRFSKYKDFDTYKKEDFLSELTFQLSYTFGIKKSFEHEQLKSSYLNIYQRYSELTSSDGKGIVKDIESLNGLIVETQHNVFEFSHLSLQEYLCAKYLVTIPFSKMHYELMYQFPTALSIANVLSPRPDEWFSMLFLYKINQKTFPLKTERIYEFLDRLILENIVFPKPSKEIGFAIIYLKSEFENSKLQNKLEEFIEIKNVAESIELTKQYYRISKEKGKVFLTRNKRPNPTTLPIESLNSKSFEIKNNYAQHWL